MCWRRLFPVLLLLASWAAAQVPPPPTIVRSAPSASAAAAVPAVASPPQGPFSVTHYDLDLSFDFPAHQLEATAKLTLNPTLLLSSASFKLNQNLVVASVTDSSGTSLGQMRQQDQVVVTFPVPLQPGAATALTFHYAGPLADARLSPISGIRTAYIGPDGAFLLYPGEWFPMAGYGTDRFSASISATLPAGMTMIASGQGTTTTAASGSVITYHFEQSQPSFPGSVIVTALKPQTFTNAGVASTFYFGPDVPADLTSQYAVAAADIYTFLTNSLGTPPSLPLQFVELPADALPSFSSPGLIVLSKPSIGTVVNTNLLVDEIAQQWFGVMLSPASLNDAWLQYGAARYVEALYVQHAQGNAAWQELVKELEIGALSYPDTALSNSSQLYVFSPQFQDLNYDKGAMLFHMLRWQLGDQPFDNALRNVINAFAWKPISTAEFERSLETSTKSDLRSFFSQWYQGTAVPSFTNQYTIYRLQKGGYRVTGKIQQSLDLFNMPVEVAIATDGATETRTVQVSGSDSDFTVDVSGRPEKVTVDPSNWILKSSPELNLRVDLSRGDNLVAAGDYAGGIKQYQAALALNPISSLAQYRIAEAYYSEQNWQNAADAYRQAMNGDLDPAWIAVWSHIQLGKIFDLTGQRDRALNEYQLAIATHDDTNGAQALAREYLKSPYKSAVSGN
ncbi:MAG TPA: M1 family aminopeptidase [Terriglobales bacterium]|nr:M1 family aminopeptidase [Terriglobales bacterium]